MMNSALCSGPPRHGQKQAWTGTAAFSELHLHEEDFVIHLREGVEKQGGWIETHKFNGISTKEPLL